MKVCELMIDVKMNRWHRFLFWSVNIPRYFLGMDIVVYRCMMGIKASRGFKKMRIQTEK